MELLRRVVLKRPVERVGFIWRIQGREGFKAGDSKDDGYTVGWIVDCGVDPKIKEGNSKILLGASWHQIPARLAHVQIMMYRLDVSMQILGCQTI